MSRWRGSPRFSGGEWKEKLCPLFATLFASLHGKEVTTWERSREIVSVQHDQTVRLHPFKKVHAICAA
jgi:hypothetical protein